jgi:hypothetical protein
VKKIRRTRIRTETRKVVFIQEMTRGTDEAGRAAHEFCPACGQPLVAPLTETAALPELCPEIHEETIREGVFDLQKKEE